MSADKVYKCDRCGKEIPESQMVKYGSRYVAEGAQYIFGIDRKINQRGKGVWHGSRLLFCPFCRDSLQRFFDDWMKLLEEESKK